MDLTMRVEQTNEYKNRIKYLRDEDAFVETEYGSMMYTRGFKGVYGWVKGTGTPPQNHLDIYLITDMKSKLGEWIDVKAIGCFKRNDGDHKIIALPKGREENDITELDNEEIEMLKKLYPRVDEGEGWFGKDVAIEIIKSYMK